MPPHGTSSVGAGQPRRLDGALEAVLRSWIGALDGSSLEVVETGENVQAI